MLDPKHVFKAVEVDDAPATVDVLHKRAATRKRQRDGYDETLCPCDMDDAGHWWFGNVEGQKKQGWFPTEYVRKVRKVAFVVAALLAV